MDGPYNCGVLVCAEITHNTDALDRKKNGERLPDLVVEIGSANLFEHNCVGSLESCNAVGSYFS